MRERARIAALLATLLLLCATVASCTATARVSDLYTALDGNGDRKRNIFFTDTKEIHCVVEAGISRKGVTLEVLVRQDQEYDFEVDKFFDFDRVSVNVEISPPPAEGIQKTDVVIKPKAPDGSDTDGSPFAPGHFQCEAYLDGHLEQVAIYNVIFPACPTAAIRPGTVCYGFYEKGKPCPKYGVTSRDPLQCRCSVTAGWECDKG